MSCRAESPVHTTKSICCKEVSGRSKEARQRPLHLSCYLEPTGESHRLDSTASRKMTLGLPNVPLPHALDGNFPRDLRQRRRMGRDESLLHVRVRLLPRARGTHRSCVETSHAASCWGLSSWCSLSAPGRAGERLPRRGQPAAALQREMVSKAYRLNCSVGISSMAAL